MPKKMWTSHTYKSCAKSVTILINGKWFVETKPNKKDNPRGWVVTDHTNVIINPSEELLSQFKKIDRVYYDKKNVSFSHEQGEYILFDKEGCFILEKGE
jgi:hypothetical protein